MRKARETPGMIKEQIDIGILAALAARGRTEQVEMLNAELLQLGFVLLQLGNGFAAFHPLSRQHYCIILRRIGSPSDQAISSPGWGGSPPLRRINPSNAFMSARSRRSAKNPPVLIAPRFSATPVPSNWLTLMPSSF